MRTLLAFCLLASCVVPAPVQDDLMRNQYGVVLRWDPDDFPLYVVPHPNLSLADMYVVTVAAEMWNVAIGKEVFVVVPVGREFVMFKQHDVYAHRAITVEYADLGWLVENVVRIRGVASPKLHPQRWSRGLLFSVRTFLDTEPVTTDYRLVVMTHELGHALGLGHDDAGSGSLMAPMPSHSCFFENQDLLHIRSMMNGDVSR